jgi:carboxymethylenebutenolidase
METHAEDIQIDGRTAVVVRPVQQGRWPGVVMAHEVFGIDDVLRRHAQRLASAGFIVYAPDFLGDGPWLRCIRSAFRALQERSGKPFEVFEAARQHVREDATCNGKVGVIGFCMGGGFALLLSADGYDASAVNYGPIPDDIEDVASRACPIVASYGGKDRMADDVPALTAALETHAVRHDIKVYPSAINGPTWLRPVARRLQRFTRRS